MNVPKSPPFTSPPLGTKSGVYFQGDVFHSPESSDFDSDSGLDSDSNSSQTTLEDTGVHAQFGHPLMRVLRVGSTNGEGLFEGTLPEGAISRSSSFGVASNSSWSSTSSIVYDIDYENLIDHLLNQNPTFDAESPNMMLVEPSSPEQRDSLMIRCLPRTSEELLLLLELNHKELRSDPWNPVPHLRCAIERKDNVYLCMEQLNPCDQPPFKTVANYIDFFRQILEVPRVEPKIKSLVRAMTGGGFEAEDARKLFEAMCKSFEATTLDTPSVVPGSCESTLTLPIPKRSTPLIFLPPISD
ncbi:hypothetical protein H0H87_007162 [Tephrocybe sp. NHM501043]|nr:hypothetical protein H0H87_007162 [Tephrocybe sp. NHM501043]